MFVKHKCPRQRPISMMAKVTRTNTLIPVQRSCHKECSCAILKLENWLFCYVFFLNVKLMSRSRGLVPPKWSYISQGVFMWNIKTWGLTVQKLFAMLKFSENRSNSKVKGKKCWYPQKDLVTKNTYVKYQISGSHCPKAFCKVKLSFQKNKVKLQGQGLRVKNVCTHRKVLSQKYSCEISKLCLSLFKSYWQNKSFQKVS